jgi:hypothetical protein
LKPPLFPATSSYKKSKALFLRLFIVEKKGGKNHETIKTGKRKWKIKTQTLLW